MSPCKPTTTKTKCPCLDHTYARELGVEVFQIRRAGGAEKLRTLSPEARAILIKLQPRSPTPQIQNKYAGGLKARGMRTRVPAIKTNPPEDYLDA